MSRGYLDEDGEWVWKLKKKSLVIIMGWICSVLVNGLLECKSIKGWLIFRIVNKCFWFLILKKEIYFCDVICIFLNSCK